MNKRSLLLNSMLNL